MAERDKERCPDSISIEEDAQNAVRLNIKKVNQKKHG